MSATNAIHKAIYATLSADAGLTALIGTGRIFDDVPPATRPPYLVFASASVSDWGTGTETGEEHGLAIEIWSAQKGRQQAAAIAGAVREALAGLGAIDPPFHLVNFAHRSTRIERDPQTDNFRAMLRFRAVTEPA